ncbi:hypothetical protein LRS74_12635 [Streptomyces sp. LX-29]|uniref:hypothetical protein n=1 Tax=Streptomyces sp. LX-29 TaxID=2900152 RepID=UPI00240DB630|nr:hypothetical protein [Streptomyces sp. LX-29]WFB07795.1 hypothetical protein LRS74_12635 [Streptomyces sp. LX-29]
MLTFPVVHGYWCECLIHSPGESHADQVAAIEQHSPEQATRWIRITIRTISFALDLDAGAEAWDWVDRGYKDMENALSNGEPASFTLRHQDSEMRWTARPVIFLPLAHRTATRLPACAEQFQCPTPYKLT